MSSKRRGLGRGLDALLETADPREETTSVAIGELRPNRYQPRTTFDSPALAELAASIEAQGVVQPVVVTPREGGGYTIIAGERRWRAARQAGLDTIPVVVREVASDLEMFEMALVENLQRSDLNPIEEAEAYKRLQEEFGLKQEEIAARVGKGRSTVANALRLLALPAEVQDLLRSGALTAGHVRPLVSLASPEDQIRWARRITRKRLTARQVEDGVSGQSRTAKRSKAKADPDTVAAQESLTKTLQTKVQIRRRGKGGTLIIAFHSEEELIRLYDLLVRVGDKR